MSSHNTAQPPPGSAADPYPGYENRRSEGAVVWDEAANAWLVLGYHAARQVLGGSGWTSDPLANPATLAAMDSVGPELVNRAMVFADGANHARLRGSVRDVFTPRFVAGLGPGIETIASAVVEHPPAGTRFDFMADIASLLPIAVIGEWLGLGGESSRLLWEQSPAIIRMLGAVADPGVIATGTAAFATLITEFLPLAADRRSRPGDDLLSIIASDPDLLLEDVVITTILIAVAGHDTTANLLGAAAVRLLTVRPDGTRIADGVDPANPSLITELLRLDGVQTSTTRTATEDQHVGGIDIARGQQVVVVIAAANRDPAVFDEPDQFRQNRDGPAPLAFGYGAHRCLGAALARLEVTVALRQILARNPTLCDPVIWRDATETHGLLNVPMVFHR